MRTTSTRTSTIMKATGTAVVALGLAASAITGTGSSASAAERDPSRAATGQPYVTAGAPGSAGTAARAMAAEDAPTTTELLEKCDNGELDVCEFHPSGETIATGEYKLAGGHENCGSGADTRDVQWSATEGETNSMGISLEASYGLKDVFSASITTTYGHEWTWSKTQTDKVSETIQPGKGVNIFVAADRSTVTGTYEMHFGDPFYGHYYWYVNDVSVSAPTHNTAWHTRTEGKDANC